MNFKSFYTKILYLAYFFFSWGIGFTVYSNSSVIEAVNGRDSIGPIYAISAALTLFLSTWIIPHVVKFLGNRKTVALAIALELLAIIGIKFVSDPSLFAISFILFLAAQILISFSFDIFFEHNTNTQNSGKVRGFVVALQHIGRMLGPILAAVISVKMGLRAPYAISFALLLLTGALLYFATKEFRDKTYVPSSLIGSLKVILARPNVFKPLWSLLLLQTFYAVMVAFVPIYLLDVINIDLESLGVIFTIMLAPFVLLAYPIGKIIDGGVSGRRAARYGLIIMALATLTIPFVHSKSLWVWGMILFISRIGAVLLETAGEAIFFKGIKEEETELLGIMRDTQPIGYFIGSIIAMLTLVLGSLVHIFYVIAIILLIGVFLTKKKKHANQ